MAGPELVPGGATAADGTPAAADGASAAALDDGPAALDDAGSPPPKIPVNILEPVAVDDASAEVTTSVIPRAETQSTNCSSMSCSDESTTSFHAPSLSRVVSYFDVKISDRKKLLEKKLAVCRFSEKLKDFWGTNCWFAAFRKRYIYFLVYRFPPFCPR